MGTDSSAFGASPVIDTLGVELVIVLKSICDGHFNGVVSLPIVSRRQGYKCQRLSRPRDVETVDFEFERVSF